MSSVFKQENLSGFIIAILACIMSLSFFNFPGTTDVDIFKHWINNVTQYGLVKGYVANDEAYPPICSMILFCVSKISSFLGITIMASFKGSLLIFLLSTSLAVLLWTKDILVASMMQLSLVLNTMALGYIDIYFAPSLVLAFWALKQKKMPLFSVFFTISCLTKWQPVIVLPIIFIHITGVESLSDFKSVDWKQLFVSAVLPGLLVFFVFVCFFGREMVAAFDEATSDVTLSGNAANMPWIVTHFLHYLAPERYGPLIAGQASYIIPNLQLALPFRLIFYFTYILTMLSSITCKKNFINLLIYSVVGFLCYSTFNTGVHENHLFVPCVLGLLLYGENRKYLNTAIVIALLFNINMFIFYGIDGKAFPFNRVAGVDVALLLSISSVIFFLVMFIPIVKNLIDEINKLRLLRRV